MTVPDSRVRALNTHTARADGAYVLYWMVANRRAGWNASLQRAVAHANRLGVPLVVLEALRTAYPWASDRLHAFVLEGMADNRAAFDRPGVRYLPYLESEHGAGSGLLETLASQASVVVTDDYPAFFLRRMVPTVGARLPVLAEAVDGNGLYPMRATDRVFARAFDFRRHLQRELPAHLAWFPHAVPLDALTVREAPRLPDLQRWPLLTRDQLDRPRDLLAPLPIDHTVRAVTLRGGSAAANERMTRFVGHLLDRYATERNQPEADVASGLSPYLHFGHISAHEIASAVMRREDWTLDRLSGRVNGARNGWWGLSDAAESFLDELVTWREVGFNACTHLDDPDHWESLPQWARDTLDAHASDPRPWRYDLDDLLRARTHDPLWNAAQNQLREHGVIHNYLRMLWGKKILEWSPTPRLALDVMIELNNRLALDGRDPNSTSGIMWVLGRYDRAWGPERPIFGTIRYMSSENTARKVRVGTYIRTYGG